MNVNVSGKGRIVTTDSLNKTDALCHVCHKRVMVINRTPDGKDACQDCYPATKGLIDTVAEPDAR